MELSEREKQVVELLSQGLSAKYIGQRLDISHRTVEYHVRTVRLKLGATNIAHLVLRAVQSGVLVI